MRTCRFRLLSAFCGLLIPASGFVLSCITRHLLSWIPIVGFFLIPGVMIVVEHPAVSTGRMLGLPIDSGATAFFGYELSLFGHLWVFLFWIAAGLIGGSIFEKLNALFWCSSVP